MGGVNIPPNVTTLAATLVTAISATLNGNAVDGGQWWLSGSYGAGTVATRGFYWGTNPNPTSADNNVVVAGTTGVYSANITGLSSNTTYYFVAYVIPVDAGVGPNPGYGATLSFRFMLPFELFNKRYLYKVYSGGQYLGNLPSVTSDFAVSQDINTVASQITVQCAISADTAANQSVTTIMDETGASIQDEASNDLLSEGVPPVVGLGTVAGSLIRNGNRVVVWEYGYYHPNGKIMFNGKIERWEAAYGGDTGSDGINMLIYGDGQDLDNYLIKGTPFTYTLDQSQIVQDTGVAEFHNSIGQWNYYGQSFTVGAGFTNLGAISLLLNGNATVTITAYSSTAMTTIIAVVTQVVSVAVATEIQFGFPSHAIVTPGSVLFFTVTVNSGDSLTIYYKNSSVYASGSLYSSLYTGGGGGGSWNSTSTQDLYFKTFSSSGSTIATFTAVDPSIGMLKPAMNDYNAQGGIIKYTTTSIQATGLSLTYKFNTSTVYEGIQAIESISPGTFYYYLDLGTSVLWFRSASVTPDIILTKGLHLNQVTIIATIEYMNNTVYTSGADISGSNIYTLDTDAASVAQYGVRLIRKNDSHIQDVTTAHAVGSSQVSSSKDEKYQSTVTIVDKTMDITLLHVGMVVKFNGFGTFVDTMLSQIVRVDYKPDSATITLGILPHRNDVALDQVTRSIIASNTIANPTSPS